MVLPSGKNERLASFGEYKIFRFSLRIFHLTKDDVTASKVSFARREEATPEHFKALSHLSSVETRDPFNIFTSIALSESAFGSRQHICVNDSTNAQSDNNPSDQDSRAPTPIATNPSSLERIIVLS